MMKAQPASRLHGVAIASAFAVLSLALGGASCDKKSAAKPTDPGPAVPFEAPSKPAIKAEAAPAQPETAAAKPEAAAASGDRYAKLTEKLPSPCGKAESLKRTLESDPGCKSAPFAKKFVEDMVKLDAGDDEIEDLYRKRFTEREERHLTLRDTPFAGTPNAPVVMVEFYDYACPHCRDAAPILEQVISSRRSDVTFYFKQYPLRRESMDLARGAIAAYRQGKFKDVHLKLFSAATRDDVIKIATEAGLVMARFKKDYDDPATTAKITADKEEGQKAGVMGTPTIYMNNRVYMDALTPERLNDWIDEELALNR